MDDFFVLGLSLFASILAIFGFRYYSKKRDEEMKELFREMDEYHEKRLNELLNKTENDRNNEK